MIGFILVLLVVGIVAGAIARVVVPGNTEMSLGATWVLGVIGSFVGGFLGRLLFNRDADDGYIQVSGIVGSIIGAVIVLVIYRAMNGKALQS